jgi:hypothetical protein
VGSEMCIRDRYKMRRAFPDRGFTVRIYFEDIRYAVRR